MQYQTGLAIATLLLTSTLISCVSSKATNVGGTWNGTVSDQEANPPVQGGSATLVITEKNSGDLTARFSINSLNASLACTGDQDLVGRVSGMQVHLSAADQMTQAVIKATLNSDGRQLNGTYAFGSPGVGCEESGNISLTKQ